MKNQITNESDCELVQMSISDAIDSNSTLSQSEQQHITNCSECLAFQQMWQLQPASNIHHIATGDLLEQSNLSASIISSLEGKQQKSIIRGKSLNTGKLLKIATIAATVTILTTLTFFFSNNKDSVVNSHISEKTNNFHETQNLIDIKLQNIEIKLTQEDIQSSLEKSYTNLSETVSAKWETTTSSLSRATELITTETFSLPEKLFSPPNDQTFNTKDRQTILACPLIA